MSERTIEKEYKEFRARIHEMVEEEVKKIEDKVREVEKEAEKVGEEVENLLKSQKGKG